MYSLTVVDNDDNIIGPSNYERIHTEGLLHRFVLVYIFDNKDNFLLQKRSSNKPHGCMFGESVCAHVRYGEEYIQAAKRRMFEELGIDINEKDLKEIVKIHTYTKDKDWKNNAFVKIYKYILTSNQTIKRNKDEIEDIEFIHIEKVKELFEKSPDMFVPGFKETFNAYLNSKH